jgi:general stress protein 26
MGELKSLTDQEGIKKLKEFVKDINVCFFCTNLTSMPIHARPMSTQDVDEEGNLWFISSSESNKNFELQDDNRVQLFYSKIPDSHYLSVYGTATIYRDKATIDEMWDPIAKAWFEQGKDDPKVTVIKVSPSDAYYWDTKDGKIIALIKMASAAVLGTGGNDGGIEGEIKL